MSSGHAKAHDLVTGLSQETFLEFDPKDISLKFMCSFHHVYLSFFIKVRKIEILASKISLSGSPHASLMYAIVGVSLADTKFHYSLVAGNFCIYSVL